MLKTKIISSSITNLTDARYFSAWDVMGLGFDLNEGSSHFIPPNELLSIREWVSGPKIIGEFSGLQSQSEIEETIGVLNLDMVQLGTFAPSEYHFSVPVLREVLIQNGASNVEADLLILKSEQANQTIEEIIKSVKVMNLTVPAYLDFNINANDISAILNSKLFEGIILRGGEEEKIGFKSYDEIDEILERLEMED